MKLFSTIIVLLLFSSFAVPAKGASPASIATEAKIMGQLKSNPSNPVANYDYMMFLYEEDRFTEARRAAAKLIQVDEDKVYTKTAIAMQKHISELLKVNDPTTKESLRKAFREKLEARTMAQVEKAFEEPETTLEDIEEETAPVIELSNSEKLREKYHICKRSYKQSAEEKQDAKALDTYSSGNIGQDQEVIYRNLIKTYPNSTKLIGDYIVYLIRKNQLRKVDVLMGKAIKKFPTDPYINFLNDHYSPIRSSQSQNGRKSAAGKFKNALIDYYMARAECSLR